MQIAALIQTAVTVSIQCMVQLISRFSLHTELPPPPLLRAPAMLKHVIDCWEMLISRSHSKQLLVRILLSATRERAALLVVTSSGLNTDR